MFNSFLSGEGLVPNYDVGSYTDRRFPIQTIWLALFLFAHSFWPSTLVLRRPEGSREHEQGQPGGGNRQPVFAYEPRQLFGTKPPPENHFFTHFQK